MDTTVQTLGNYTIHIEPYTNRRGWEWEYAIYHADGRRIFRAGNLAFAQTLLYNLNHLNPVGMVPLHLR